MNELLRTKTNIMIDRTFIISFLLIYFFIFFTIYMYVLISPRLSKEQNILLQK